MSRIDNFLVSKHWGEHFADAIQLALSRGLSDHRLIKFNWIGVRGLSDLRTVSSYIRISCLSIKIGGRKLLGYAGFRIVKKLQCLKSKIKEWKKYEAGRVEEIRANAFKEHEKCDLVE